MRVISHRIPYKIGQKHRLVLFSDVHYGNSLCSEKNFMEMIRRHKDEPDTYFACIGDLFDAIISNGGSDKRYEPPAIKASHAVLPAPANVAVHEMADILKPIKNKLLWINDGNHELSFMKNHGTDLTSLLLHRLGLQEHKVRLGYAGFIVLRFTWHKALTNGDLSKGAHSRSLVTYSCHGIGAAGGKSEGGYQTSIGTNAKSYRAGLHVYGHNHRIGVWDNVVIAVNDRASKIVSLREIRANTGTFLRSFSDNAYTSYSEKAQYRPNELGYCVVDIEHNKCDMEITGYKRVFT